MKRLKFGSVFGITLALALFALNTASAQTYSIDWYKVAGGGGTSTGAQYVVSGTIGQHDAGGPMTGGNYSLTGGFWSLVAAIQTPGAPFLTVFHTPTNTVVISWPAPSTGFALQQNGDLRTTSWSPATGTFSVVNGQNQVIVSPPIGNQFYRLKQ
ncbi:MAG TPA: hypothetical protein VNZ64_02275 [Candidatus Acidoferrum sp.]|nr:hypothetical protein [Candidatus Acidoferrum sp.]